MVTQITFSGNTVYWKTRKLGTIYPGESTFQSVKRTPINIFEMFNGLNKEMLNLLFRMGIRFIEVPFCSQILKTTTTKWLRKGIPSPYVSDRVDQQIILRLDKINLDENEPTKMIIPDNQLLLWST